MAAMTATLFEEPTAPPRATYPSAHGVARAVVRGRAVDAAWVRPAVLGLLGATAVLYLWGLGASGWWPRAPSPRRWPT